MVALVIGITTALGFAALGLGVFVLGQPARTPGMLDQRAHPDRNRRFR